MTPTKILIVEDEFSLVEILIAKLSKRGYTVCAVADTAKAAVEQARKEAPDLVLMDILLKGKRDGIDAAEQIRSECGTPVVYLTAHLDSRLLERAKITEPFGYILKPINERELFAVMELALYKAETERRLKESELKFRTVADFAQDWELWVAPDGRFLYSSPSCERITGFDREDFMANPELFFEIMHQEDAKKVRSKFEKMKKGNAPGNIEYAIATSSCRKKWVRLACTPVFSEIGESNGLRVTIRDITEERKADLEKLEKRELEDLCLYAGAMGRQAGQMIADALEHIGGALRNKDSEGRLEECLAQAERSCLLAREFAAKCEFPNARIEWKTERTDVKKLVEMSAKSALKGSRIRCEYSFAKGLKKIAANPKAMRRALGHIVESAKDAMSGQGALRIEVDHCDAGPSRDGGVEIETGGLVRIAVIDKGGGMSEDAKRKMFDPFFSTRPNAAEERAGLGLSVAYAIVKKHGGRIEVESEPGEGSTVAVLLPAVS